MESNLVDQSMSDREKFILLVNDFFKTNFQCFEFIGSGILMGYWQVEYECKPQKLRIIFDGDLGGHFLVKIIIDEKEYSLWQYDRSLIDRSLSTIENLQLQLNVLKRFLE